MFEQGHTSCFGELGVQTKHLDREDDLVDYSLARGLSLRPKFEIVGAVIIAVAVFVMYVFVGQQFPSKYFFHHDTMLVKLDAASAMDSSIARRNEVTSIGDGTGAPTFVPALYTAESLLPVVPQKLAVGFSSDFWSFPVLTTISTLEHGRGLAVHVERYNPYSVLVKEIF